MLDRTSSLTGAPGKGSPISQGLSLLGSAGGIGVAILLTPLLHELIKHPLSQYLAKHWGPEMASVLSLVMFGIEGVITYVLTKLTIVSVLTAAIITLAARRIPFA
jgi:hypothetical protein